MSHCLCIPSFRKHVYADDTLHLLTWLALFTYSIYSLAQCLCEFTFILRHFISFLGLNFIQGFLVDAKQPIAQFFGHQVTIFDCIFNTSRRFRTITYHYHYGWGFNSWSKLLPILFLS